MGAWIALFRVKHWLKNLLVLFPLFFSGNALSTSGLLEGFVGVASFCLASSAIYVMNDLLDVSADRRHPKKKERPIASGAIKAPVAAASAVVLVLVAVALTVTFAVSTVGSCVILLAYIFLNGIYSLGLKKVPVIDVALLASGFVLRVLFGGTMCGIPVSSWLFLTILALSLFFALGKRRGELRCFGTTSREVLKRYPEAFLDKSMYLCLGLGLMFYSLWTFERIGGAFVVFNTASMFYIAGIVMAFLVCLRYSFDVEGPDSDGDPVDVLLHDKMILGMLAIWVVVMIVTVYVI